MAAADPSSHNNGFDKALKSYAANMAMSGYFWPMGAAAAADSSTGSMFAYSQASALAAAASSIQSLTTGHNGNNGNVGPSNNGVSSATLSYATPVGHHNGNGVGLFGAGNATMACGTLSLPAQSTTPGTPKKKPQPVPDTMKDESYWERRKRNNESARRSRELRRSKEEQIAYHVMKLEAENLQLKTELHMLRNEMERLRNMIAYQNNHH